MKKFTTLTSKVAPYIQNDTNTDQIIPSEFLKDINADLKFGLFAYLRRNSKGESLKKFILEKDFFIDSKILLVGRNFGCGSSREHAVWALQEFGFLCIIALSFSELFKNNCLKNGILTIELSEEKFLKLKDIFIDEINFNLLTVDLINQTLVDQTGNEISKFDIDINSKLMLTQGLDEIDLTLKELNKIKNWESKLEPISLLLQKSIA
jgi:3-isopropylmalate dehydratase small subunit